MKSIIILLQLAIVIFLLVLLRFLLQRIRLYFQLNRFAKKYGFCCQILKKAFYLPLNSIKGNTVTLETDSCIYDIKVFGLLRKHCEIHFWGVTEYSMEWYFSRYGLDHKPYQFIGMTNEKKRRPIGAFGNNAETQSTKKHTSVLLLSPTHAPVRLTYRKENHLERLHAGDMIENAIFADLDYLFMYICKQENKDI